MKKFHSVSVFQCVFLKIEIKTLANYLTTYLSRSAFLMTLIALTVVSGGLLATSLTRSVLSAADLFLSRGAPRILAGLLRATVMHWFD